MRGKFATIGKLDRRITINNVSRTANDYGEPVESDTTLATVWASRLDDNGLERYEQGQLTSTRTVDWVIRYLGTVREDMTITYDTETFKIVSIEEIGRKWGMRLKTELKR